MSKVESYDPFEIFGIKKEKKDKEGKKEKKDKKEKKEKSEEEINNIVIDESEKRIDKRKKEKEKKEKEEQEEKEKKEKQRKSVKVTCPYSGKQYTYTQPINPLLGPYGTTWVHDEQDKDDELDENEKESAKKVKKLLEIEYPAQRSKAWFDLRKGCISASDAGCVVGDNQHEPQYMMYLKKLLEPPFEPNAACYHGTKLEQIATMVYEYRMNVRVEEFGLVKHPDIKFIGASPDGIVGKYKLNGKNLTKYVGTMLEIKCPKSREINDDDPFEEIKYYERQVQQQLEVCKLKQCHFWQCRIREYETRDEFMADTDEKEPFRSKSYGMEKGCLIQLLPRAKMGELKDKPNEIIYGESKFLYPSKIDMTPLECDMWISETVNNLEKTLIDKVIDKYSDIKNKILNSIKNANFMIYYKEDIKAKVDSLVLWLINEKHAKIGKDFESNQFTKKAKEMMEDYTKNYVQKLNDPKFVKFLVMSEIEDYDDIKNDMQLYEKIINPDLDEVFCNKINSDQKLSFIKSLSLLLRELEFPKKYCFHRVYYWRVEKTNCTTVKRDKEWFKKSLPIFENIWKNIEYMRENPDCVKVLLNYIDSLPTVEKHFGKEYKENEKVMEFVDFMCNPPNKDNEKAVKKYEKKIKEFSFEKEKEKEK
jgi:putative phage-type endonuclease